MVVPSDEEDVAMRFLEAVDIADLCEFVWIVEIESEARTGFGSHQILDRGDHAPEAVAVESGSNKAQLSDCRDDDDLGAVEHLLVSSDRWVVESWRG